MTPISSLISAALLVGSLIAPTVAALDTAGAAGAGQATSASAARTATSSTADETADETGEDVTGDDSAGEDSALDETTTTPPAELPTDLTLEIVPTTPGTISPGTPLSLSVTVDNNTGESRPQSTVVVVLDRVVSTDRVELLERLDSPTASASPSRAEIARVPLQALPAGASVDLPPIVVEPEALSSITTDAFGAHVVSAEVVSDAGSLGSVASVVTIDPGDTTSNSTLSLAMPVTVPVTAAGVLDADTLESYTSPDGLLSKQLDETAGRPIALGIDPRIIASIRSLGEDTPESAVAWLDRLDAVGNETFALTYADSDIAATSQAGLGVLAPLGFDIDPTRFDGTVVEESPGPTTSAVPTPSPTPSVAPDGANVPSTETLLDWDYSADGIAWPRESTVVSGDFGAFAASGLTTTILDSDSITAAGGSVAAAVTIGESNAVVSDAAVSDLLREAVNASTEGEWRADMARLTGALATLVADDPAAANEVLATFERNSGLGVYRVGQTVQALNSLPWLESSTLAGARSSEPTAAALVESPVDAERIARIAELAQAESNVTQFATVLDDAVALTAPARLAFLALSSQEWATELAAPAWPAGVESFVADCAETVSSVQLASTTDFVLAADNAALPIPIVNELDVPATVFVTVRPQTAILDVRESLVEITVPPGSQTRALVPVSSVANGQVLVNISLTSAAGVAIGSPVAVEVDVRAGWDTAVTTVLFTLVALVFVLGIIRTIRRNRARRRAANDPDVSVTQSDADVGDAESPDTTPDAAPPTKGPRDD